MTVGGAWCRYPSPQKPVRAAPKKIVTRGSMVPSPRAQFALLHVVPPAPSSREMPWASRSSRIRSASAKFFALRRSEEHTSELQSLMRISYAVFCLKKKKDNKDKKADEHTSNNNT